mgnify:CR=1 FL=1
MTVKITSDSTCDLSPELLRQYDVSITPLSVCCGERVGADGTEITPDDIYEYVHAEGKLPQTSAVNVADYMEEFHRWTKQGCYVVHFCLGSEFSSTYQNACLAAKEVGNVFVVDSCNLSTGQGLLVLRAAEMATQGYYAQEIWRTCTALTKQVEASFVVDSLDYLYKGGRCSALGAFGANLLRIKPCIEVRNGKMIPAKKYRGRIEKVMLQYVEDRLRARSDIDKSRIFITHTACSPEAVRAVHDKVLELAPDFQDVLNTTAGATITSHCGPNTLGILFLRTR